MEIRWLKKGKNSRLCSNDVRVSLIGKGKYATISFFNGSYERITEGDNIQLGICENRIYFRGSDKNCGNKVQYYAKTVRVNFSNDELIDFVKKHKAEYELEYDVENNLFYIEDKESNV